MTTPNYTDILFLKQDEKFDNLENIINQQSKKLNLSFISKYIPDYTTDKKIMSSKVIFFAPSNATLPSAKDLIDGISQNYSKEAIVIVHDKTSEEIKKYYTEQHSLLNNNSTEKEISDLFSQKLTKSLNPPPYALLILEKDADKYKSTLVDAGYNVKTIVKDNCTITEVEYFDINKNEVDLVLLEGKTHIKNLSEIIFSIYPNATIVGIGEKTIGRIAYNKGLIYYLNDKEGIKAFKEFAKKRNKNTGNLSNTYGKCFILAGPPSAGKSEAGFQIKEALSDIKRDVYIVKKHTTRKKRPDEEEYKHLIFKTWDEMRSLGKGRKYLFTYTFKDHKYGIPTSLIENLQKGDDSILLWGDTNTLTDIIRKLNHYKEDITVPILFYADPFTLKKRLIERNDDINEKNKRLKTIENELYRFLDQNQPFYKFFKYAINTSNSNISEVKRLLKAIVEWETLYSEKQYINTVCEKILPADCIDKALFGKPMKLIIPDKIMEDYSREKSISLKTFNHLKQTDVEFVSFAYGRVGVWLKGLEEMRIYNPREILLDLIERSIPLDYRCRNPHWYHYPISIFAKCSDNQTQFNDGLLYMLGDDFNDRPISGSERYAVSFGFVRSKGNYKALPIKKNEKESWENISNMLKITPLSSRGNMEY